MALSCKVSGCDNSVAAKNLCPKHYWRVRKYGTSDNTERMMPEEQRFWAKVDKKSPSECWEWTASREGTGYGRFRYNEGQLAHRYSYFLHNPDDMGVLDKEVMHTCDNRSCVNPNHLKLGTHKENMEDMAQKGRHVMWDNRGSKNPRAKITEGLAKAVYLWGIPYKAIAEKLNIGYSTVLDIKSGRRWQHATKNLKRNSRELIEL